MKIALAQIQITDSMEENYHKALNCIKEAAVNGTELIAFQKFSSLLSSLNMRSSMQVTFYSLFLILM